MKMSLSISAQDYTMKMFMVACTYGTLLHPPRTHENLPKPYLDIIRVYEQLISNEKTCIMSGLGPTKVMYKMPNFLKCTSMGAI